MSGQQRIRTPRVLPWGSAASAGGARGAPAQVTSIASQVGRRLTLTTPVAILGAMMLASAASAAERHFVDDDGRAGPSGCGGEAQAARTIQEAIDGAGAADLVTVCPGTYTELLGVATDGLAIRGVGKRLPVIRAPRRRGADLRWHGRGGRGVVAIASDSVTIAGFRFRPHGGDGTCDQGPFIDVLGDASVTIRDNDFAAQRPFATSCSGYDIAVSAAAWGDEVRVGLIVVGNTIRDFNGTGVEVYADGATGAGGEAVVAHNRFLLRHDVLSRHHPGALRDRGRVAIAARDVAVHVIANVVSASRDAPPLDGILLDGALPDVRGNRIEGVRTGISGDEGVGTVADNWIVGTATTDSGTEFDLLLLYAGRDLAAEGGVALPSPGDEEVHIQRAAILYEYDEAEATDAGDGE